MELIGLSGYARAGKDEAARGLMDSGFERKAFADKLRNFLYELNPIVTGVLHPSSHPKITGYVRVQDVIKSHGWDGYKETPFVDEIRPLLQRLGTEAGRGVLWDSIWIDAAMHDLEPGGRYVFADCRFPNEAEAIRVRGGKIVRVTRPGVGPANSHPSETSLDNYDFDAVVSNDGTIEEFHEKIRSLV